MIDQRVRYKPQYLGFNAFEVVEEHTDHVVTPGPLSYDQAQDDADRRNSELALRRAT